MNEIFVSIIKHNQRTNYAHVSLKTSKERYMRFYKRNKKQLKNKICASISQNNERRKHAFLLVKTLKERNICCYK